MTFGVLLMHELLADSWDIQALVSFNIIVQFTSFLLALHTNIQPMHATDCLYGIGLLITKHEPVEQTVPDAMHAIKDVVRREAL